MSLIYACQLVQRNPFEYLVELQQHADKLKAHPQDGHTFRDAGSKIDLFSESFSVSCYHPAVKWGSLHQSEGLQLLSIEQLGGLNFWRGIYQDDFHTAVGFFGSFVNFAGEFGVRNFGTGVRKARYR